MRWGLLALLVVGCGDDTTGAGVDAAIDARADARADASIDAPPDDAPPFDSGADALLTGDQLLVSDTSQNRVYLITLDGTIIRSWTTPVAQPTGVAYDRRDTDGFWVVGRANATTLYKVGWNGTTLRSFENGASTNPEWQIPTGDIRGLDYFRGASADADRLAYVKRNINSVDTLTSNFVVSGGPDSSSSFYANGFQSGYWGCAIVDVSGTVGDYVRAWCTRNASTRTLERWYGPSLEAQMTIQIDDARGVTLSPSGGFFVVDVARLLIVELDASGGTVRSFPAPGTTPAGIAYLPANIVP